MARRKWNETKQQPSLLPGPAVPGCSLVSFHFLWAILCPQAVEVKMAIFYCKIISSCDSFLWSQQCHNTREGLLLI